MRIHHICIETSIYKESLKSYTRVLNFALVKETPDFHGREYNSWLELNRFYIELQTPKKEVTLESEDRDLFKVIAPEGTIIEFRDTPLF